MRHAAATRHNPFSRPAHDPSPIQGRKTEYKKYYCVVDVIGGLTHYQAILKFNSNRPAPLALSLFYGRLFSATLLLLPLVCGARSALAGRKTVPRAPLEFPTLAGHVHRGFNMKARTTLRLP